MRLDEFMAYLAPPIEAWTKEHGGQFRVATDPLHPYVLLAGSNASIFLVILSYSGGQPLNTEQHPHGMRMAKVELFLGHPMDLRSEPGAWLFKSDGVSESILKRLDSLQARLLTICFDNGERHDKSYAEYGGEEPATLPDGTPLRAFKCTASWPIPITISDADYQFVN